MTADFEEKINNIICNLENTNYGSISGQIKLILYFQELLIKGRISKIDLLIFFKDVKIECDESNEVTSEVLGEIGQNLNNSHICKPIWDDLGESYLLYLTQMMKRMNDNKTLFRECNDW
jgi:hypothetical protein